MPPTVRWRRASPVSVLDREDTANRNPLLTNRASARTTSDGEHDCRLYAFRVARFSDESPNLRRVSGVRKVDIDSGASAGTHCHDPYRMARARSRQIARPVRRQYVARIRLSESGLRGGSLYAGGCVVVGAAKRVLVAVAVCAGVCAGTVPTASAGAGGGLERTVGANGVGAPIQWSECDPPGSGVQCANIRVPLDWDKPKGRTIRLALARHLASKPAERIGTAFINPGGPGDTGVGLLIGDPKGVDAIGDGRFDLVSWDPRGTHASTRVRCFKDSGAEQRFWAGAGFPTTVAQAGDAARRGAALAKRCGQVSGWLLPHISTADTARDLDHLRVLMGEEKMTYIGLSYGTMLGVTYANLFPQRLRAMLLDGITDPVRYTKSAEERMRMWVASGDEVLSRFFSLCAVGGPDQCALARGSVSPKEKWDQLRARARRKPIPAPGANGTLTSPQELNLGDLNVSQFQPLRAPSTWPTNAADLQSAYQGDATALENSASGFASPAGWGGATASAAIQCADGPAKLGPGSWKRFYESLNRLSPLVGAVHYAWEWAPCASWPVKGQDAYRGPWNAETPVPILLINQTHDPNSFYGNATKTQRLLANAVLLKQEGYGHLFFQDPSKCVEDAMAAYLTELKTPLNGSVCQSDQIPFKPAP